MRRKTLFVIPAYNEARNIASVIVEIASLRLDGDVVVIDDGSSDATSEVAAREGAKVLRLPFNSGYGAAVQTGLLYAVKSGYDLCVLLDGDGQHDPRYVPALIAPVASGTADLALGSRFLGRADYAIPFARRIGMTLFSALASLLTHQRITDPTSGFQAISARLMRFFADDNYPYDFPDADTIVRLHFAGFRISEIPVTIRPRLRGKSMHTLTTTLYYVYKMLFSIFIVLTQRRMLQKDIHHAADHQTAHGLEQLDRVADHRAAGEAKTT